MSKKCDDCAICIIRIDKNNIYFIREKHFEYFGHITGGYQLKFCPHCGNENKILGEIKMKENTSELKSAGELEIIVQDKIKGRQVRMEADKGRYLVDTDRMTIDRVE